MYTMMKTVALVFAPLLLEKLYAEETTPLQEACPEMGCYQQSGQGQSLLQVRRTSTFIEDGVRTSGLGSTASLDPAGFNSVRGLCCSMEMQTFISRLIKDQGYDVCLEGGLAGTVGWYDCTDDDPANDFQSLRDGLKPAADPSGDCPWLVVAGATCPPPKTTCPNTPGAFPPCGQDTNQFICCGIDNGYVPTHATINPPVSKVAIWDCQANALPIQVYLNGNSYSVSSLNLADGSYNEIWPIPLDRTSPPMEKKMNSVALNPVDGIPYATINIQDVRYIVRFDQFQFEFVARIPSKGDFFTKNIFMGAFGQSGTYFIAGKSEDVGGVDLLAIKNIANYEGFKDQNDKTMPELSKKSPGVSHTLLKPGGGADIAIANGNFDKMGSSEWLFKLKPDLQLVLAKINNADVSDLKPIVLDPATKDDGTGQTSFGAAWTYRDEVFFSRNNGGGVYHMLTDSIDIGKKSYSWKKVVQKTKETNNNDGMNCMDAAPPFPGDFCKVPGEFECDKINGACPAGSKPVAVANR